MTTKKRATVFVTGGTGFFGKSIFSMLKRGFAPMLKFTVLSRDPERFITMNPEFAEMELVDFITGDVRNFAFPARSFDYVFHAAAPTIKMPPGVVRDIVIAGTRRVLEFSRQCGAKRLLFISSGAVYGPQPPDLIGIPENFPCHPVTEYGIAKYEAEKMCLDSGIECEIARCFSFVGPYLRRDIHFAIGNFIRDCLAGRNIEIKGSGTPYRSYLYADDLVRWLFKVLFDGKPGEAYNIGSDRPISIMELAEKVRKVLHSQNPIVACEKSVPGVRPERYVPDIRKIQRELNVSVEINLEDAIMKSIQNSPQN